MNEQEYLDKLKNELLDTSNWQSPQMTRKWASTIPATAGVYVFKEGKEIVYVGETGNLQKRMIDLLDSRHHTIRRTIGQKFYSGLKKYTPATSKQKFPPHIEQCVNDHLCTKYKVAYITVTLGRKELEESIESMIDISKKLNKRGKRK